MSLSVTPPSFARFGETAPKTPRYRLPTTFIQSVIGVWITAFGERDPVRLGDTASVYLAVNGCVTCRWQRFCLFGGW